MITGLIVLMLLSMPVASQERVVPPPDPLPAELNDYYWDLRVDNRYWWDSVLCGCPPLNNLGYVIKSRSFFSPYREFEWLKFAILHDAGKSGTEDSRMAKEYLRNEVINPILEYRALKLEDGSILAYDDIAKKYANKNLDRESLDRLVTAELLYYYSRDYIVFPNPNKNPDDKMASMALPHVLAFPCETVSMQKGICWNQNIALAALYEMMGYDVALYLVPAAPYYFTGGYHAVILLKDEGWGIGDWKLERDNMGNDISGRYIVLDPMYDASFMEGKPPSEALGSMGLEFDQPSPYTTGPLGILSKIFNYIPGIQAIFIGKI
ncbi:MAG: hypothetical protein MASP_00409 [Candidatus Methanolliviera sp. GoM_asphalt]|nr:MAG: hypothetical protein MASP_00409 [Candidatus Methanolliviera sp. GoM_asphalt]